MGGRGRRRRERVRATACNWAASSRVKARNLRRDAKDAVLELLALSFEEPA